ncbi:MAG: NADP-dependent malic enzyme [Thermoplasmata archaeon]
MVCDEFAGLLVLGNTRVSDEEALEYHERRPPGKLAIESTKPTVTQRDLSLAYTPGVATVSRAIEKDPDAVFSYTGRGNLVAVVTNGTAILGLGDLGPLAAKPVMEGKAILFKKLADIDVFDLELEVSDPTRFVEMVTALQPGFGGINLEDVRSPDAFEIEERLREDLDIPVFHDDQHGTAIISGAALLNALELQGKKLKDVRIVISGAGAAGLACASFFATLGAEPDNILVVDSGGVLYRGRTDRMNRYKERFARDTEARTLADAMERADVFVGLSVGGIVTSEMVASMAEYPIVFAMANPDPEIGYEEVKAVRPDAIVATGRSDFPNQVNNVLGFPFIFRGALDVRARGISEEMKVAATHALAALAKEDVPDAVRRAYGGQDLAFGPNYILPKPFDERVLLRVAPAVAQAAMEGGMAREEVEMTAYREELRSRLGKAMEMMTVIFNKARSDPKRIVFPEGTHAKILRACQILAREGLTAPILLGNPKRVAEEMKRLRLDFEAEIIDPVSSDLLGGYTAELYELRRRKGATQREAEEMLRNPNYFGAMMVRSGAADGFISGLTSHYPDALRPALQVLGTKEGAHKVVGLYMITLKDRVLFFADATVNIEPTSEDLAEIALAAADVARRFEVYPRVAMLSFSNFGSTRHPLTDKVRRAVALVRERAPELEVDGEMQADTAVVSEILETTYPFTRLEGPANVLIFPDLEAANVAYKLMQRLADAEATGPILEGIGGAVHILQRGDDVKDVVNMGAIAVVGAQEAEES